MVTESKCGRFITITRDEGVATVVLDRGDGRNALSIEVLRDMKDVAESFADDLQTQAIILTASGPFTVGADLRDPEAARRNQAGLLERRHLLRAGPDMCDAWERVEQVTILAIETHCIGGGVALAAACDFRIAGAGANFRLPEIPLGMNMSWHAIPRLVSLLGVARARKFVLFGENLTATEAKEAGLVDEIVPDGGAISRAREWAGRLAALPPNALRMTKQSINAATNALHAATSFMDRDQFALAATSDDYREAIAAFLDKRQPKFTGR